MGVGCDGGVDMGAVVGFVDVADVVGFNVGEGAQASITNETRQIKPANVNNFLFVINSPPK